MWQAIIDFLNGETDLEEIQREDMEEYAYDLHAAGEIDDEELDDLVGDGW